MLSLMIAPVNNTFCWYSSTFVQHFPYGQGFKSPSATARSLCPIWLRVEELKEILDIGLKITY